MKKQSYIAIILASALASCATGCKHSTPVTMGEDRQILWDDWGKPNNAPLLSSKNHLPFEAWDVWHKKLDGLDTKYSVRYHDDDTNSPLNPPQRVWEIVVSIDKYQRWQDLMAAIPEARTFCSDGCQVDARYDFNFPAGEEGLIRRRATVDACPSPSAANPWHNYPNVKPCIEIEFDKGYVEGEPSAIDWDSMTAHTLGIYLVDRNPFDLHLRGVSKNFGIWRPS